MTKTIEELAIKAGLDPITSNPYWDELTHYHNVFNKDLLAICEAYHEQALLSQGEPVCTVIESKDPMKGLSLAILNSDIKVGTNLYLAPPSTEALQKENTNLKEQLSR